MTKTKRNSIIAAIIGIGSIAYQFLPPQYQVILKAASVLVQTVTGSNQPQLYEIPAPDPLAPTQ